MLGAEVGALMLQCSPDMLQYISLSSCLLMVWVHVVHTSLLNTSPTVLHVYNAQFHVCMPQVLGSTPPAGSAARQAGSSPQPRQPHAAAGSSHSTTASSSKGAAIAGIVPGAGAAASSQLLSHVGDLLAHAGSTQQRLMGVGGGGLGVAAAAEDDGICLDDVRQEQGSELEGLLPGQITQHMAAAPAELGTEVWYEHQERDASNQWVPYSPAGTSSSRDDVHPPAGWQWAGPWTLTQAAAAGAGQGAAAGIAGLVLDSISSSGASGQGVWSYSDQAPEAATWSDACTDSSRWRRRRWQRQRSRAAAGSGSQTPQQHGAATGSEQVYDSVADSVGSRDDGMVLLAVLLCTLLRGSKLQESKRAAIMLLTCAALGCDDDVRLQTVVPYLLTQLSDPHAAVR